jgi:hypothetical protein
VSLSGVFSLLSLFLTEIRPHLLGVLLLGIFCKSNAHPFWQRVVDAFVEVNTYLYGLVTYQFIVYYTSSRAPFGWILSSCTDLFLEFNDAMWIRYDRADMDWFTSSQFSP